MSFDNTKLDKEGKLTNDDLPYIIIRPYFSTFNQGYKLREGDVIRLGKQLYKIKELKLKDSLKERERTLLFDKCDTNVEKAHGNIINIPFKSKNEGNLNM
jgi:hypothetical protein